MSILGKKIWDHTETDYSGKRNEQIKFSRFNLIPKLVHFKIPWHHKEERLFRNSKAAP